MNLIKKINPIQNETPLTYDFFNFSSYLCFFTVFTFLSHCFYNHFLTVSKNIYYESELSSFAMVLVIYTFLYYLFKFSEKCDLFYARSEKSESFFLYNFLIFISNFCCYLFFFIFKYLRVVITSKTFLVIVICLSLFHLEGIASYSLELINTILCCTVAFLITYTLNFFLNKQHKVPFVSFVNKSSDFVSDLVLEFEFEISREWGEKNILFLITYFQFYISIKVFLIFRRINLFNLLFTFLLNSIKSCVDLVRIVVLNTYPLSQKALQVISSLALAYSLFFLVYIEFRVEILMFSLFLNLFINSHLKSTQRRAALLKDPTCI